MLAKSTVQLRVAKSRPPGLKLDPASNPLPGKDCSQACPLSTLPQPHSAHPSVPFYLLPLSRPRRQNSKASTLQYASPSLSQKKNGANVLYGAFPTSGAQHKGLVQAFQSIGIMLLNSWRLLENSRWHAMVLTWHACGFLKRVPLIKNS